MNTQGHEFKSSQVQKTKPNRDEQRVFYKNVPVDWTAYQQKDFCESSWIEYLELYSDGLAFSSRLVKSYLLTMFHWIVQWCSISEEMWLKY